MLTDTAKLDADPGGCKCRNIELSFGANVQQSTTESDGDRKAGEDQRCRQEQRVADAVRPRERAADQQFVGLDRTVANDEDDNATDDESGDYGNEGNRISRSSFIRFLI
jgi:hypothetical protein